MRKARPLRNALTPLRDRLGHTNSPEMKKNRGMKKYVEKRAIEVEPKPALMIEDWEGAPGVWRSVEGGLRGRLRAEIGQHRMKLERRSKIVNARKLANAKLVLPIFFPSPRNPPSPRL